ncbi:mechanosensitive ion channel family protein [Vibrio sp. S11_S32]|uniref:mechanosensitive ion channel family protein n=1 Tax=Vibrio sp. S11_S32 TaxID=2720225 RepID=UPI001680DE7D|nr:mechanosensitive ion channel family protein [Vibrio sp. S11_S32]MBD1577894.1 mechanosensitive ion channel family protein [Vibrio sp. S11_S32]
MAHIQTPLVSNVMRYAFIILSTFLSCFSSIALAAPTTSAAHQQIIEQNKNIEFLTNQALTATGNQLSIIQLELFDSNSALRSSLSDAIGSKNPETSFLIEQIKIQIANDHKYLTYLESSITELQQKTQEASKEDRLLLQIPLNEHRQILAKIYQFQYQNYVWLKKLGENDTAEMTKFTHQVNLAAKFTAASLHYSLTRQSSLNEQLTKVPVAQKGPFELELSYLQRNIDTYSKMLTIYIDIAEPLGLDTVNFKHQLFTATGAITHDFISWAMVTSTVSSVGSNIGKWLMSNSPNLIFNLFMFLLVLTIAHFIAKGANVLVTNTVKTGHLKLSNLMQQFLVSMSMKLIYSIGFLVALAQIGLDLTPILAGFGVAGIIIGFALQDTLSNFASGIMVLIYRPFDVGDWVSAAGVEGKVSHVSLVNTTIRTFNNEVLLIPNSKIWTDVIINRTYEKVRRVDMIFGISYKDSIPHAEEIFKAILDDDPRVLRSPEPIIQVDSLGDNSVNFVVRPWVKTDDLTDVRREVTREVKMRFDAEGISIPFPQRDVHIHQIDTSL